MKTTPKTILKTGAIAFIAIAISLGANAQKLNNLQEGAMRAPANIKIDAKASEWGDSFQAYNKATDVYYTMANDDANLYLVIKSTNPVNNNKIMGGGIGITINTDGKKKEKDAYVIEFPFINIATLRAQVMQGMAMMRGNGGGGAPPPPSAPGGGNGQRMPDSTAIANMRKKAIATAKEIKLTGFLKDVPDTVISIYNEYSIKAAADFDRQGSLVIELAVPLKYMHLFVDKGTEFAYNVKLNGIKIDAIFPGASAMMGGGAPGGAPGGGFGGGGGGGAGFGGGMGGGGGMPPSGAGMPRGMADMASMISPTDFWGKYTLVGDVKMLK